MAFDTEKIMSVKMKANHSIDNLAIKVQQTLFEYFYFHNKMDLEGPFKSPRLHESPLAQKPPNQQFYSLKAEDALNSECLKTSVLLKDRESLQFGKTRPVQ